MKPLHPCNSPRCSALVRTTYCPAHTTQRYKDPAQQKFYGSTQWKQIRAVVKRRDPICKLCDRSPTTNVDHIDGNYLNNDPANLRGLCDHCDRKQTGSAHRRKQLDANPAV